MLSSASGCSASELPAVFLFLDSDISLGFSPAAEAAVSVSAAAISRGRRTISQQTTVTFDGIDLEEEDKNKTFLLSSSDVWVD